MKRIPIIVTDIDGVLIYDNKPLVKVPRTIKTLRKPLSKLDPTNCKSMFRQLPLVFLTNNCTGNLLEHEKAQHLNQIFHLNSTTQEGLTDQNIILNFTAIRPKMQEFSQKLVLICGLQDTKNVSQNWGLNYFLTMEEYATLFPQLVPISRRNIDQRIELLPQILQRLPFLKEKDFNKPLKIEAIFVLGDCVRWEEHVQIICDLLSTKNGEIADSLPATAPESTIPIFWANASVMYRERSKIPRIGCGMLKVALDTCYKLLYNKPINSIEIFGKPHRSSFERAYEKARQLAGLHPISNVYMIGDSIYTDIKGANQLGWETILVRSGLHKRLNDNKSEGSPAKYVVRDFDEAIKIIFNKEGLKFHKIQQKEFVFMFQQNYL